MSNLNAIHLNEADRQLAAAHGLKEQGRLLEGAKALHGARRALLELARATGEARLKCQRLAQAERLAQLATAWERQAPSAASKEAAPQPSDKAGDNEVIARFTPETVDKALGFGAVAGLEDAKREIRLRMVLPFAHTEMAKAFKVSTGGGLLLYGPPGTGKTLLARATAAELDAAFFSVKASDVMSKWVGEAEKNVEALFASARQHPRAVIFIDEIEALVPIRAGNGSTVMARVVPQFLAEMQGFREHAGTLMVMGATNEPWAIDPAMMRPGRFDMHIHVGLPDAAGRRYQFERLLRERPVADDADLDALSALTDGYSGADIASVVERAAREAFAASIGGRLEPLNQTMLTRIIAATPPSVNCAQLARYRKFGEGMG